MSSPIIDGIAVCAYHRYFKKHPELMNLENHVIDKYWEVYRHLGVERCDMPELMKMLTFVDPLTSSDICPIAKHKK